MNLQFAVSITALVALVAPLALLVVLAVPSWLGHSLREPTIARATRLAMLSSTLGPGIALLLLLLGSVDPWVASFGAWFGWGRHGFAFDLRFDALALGFATLAAIIGSVDAVFSDRYLHRESMSAAA